MCIYFLTDVIVAVTAISVISSHCIWMSSSAELGINELFDFVESQWKHGSCKFFLLWIMFTCGDIFEQSIHSTVILKE